MGGGLGSGSVGGRQGPLKQKHEFCLGRGTVGGRQGQFHS